MFNLHPITSGIRDGRHQHYPTPNVRPQSAATESAAEETACRMLRAFNSISYLRLTSGDGTEVRVYRRGDFFHRDSPLREVHHRVSGQDLAARMATQP
jgi:hypothetical protein